MNVNRRMIRRVPLEGQARGPQDGQAPKRVVERLDEAATLELVSAVPYGRIVFVVGGEPEIRPLNHIVDDGEVVVRTHLGAALTEAIVLGDGLSASFEADLLDGDERLGWSAIVTGTASIVTDADRRSRCEKALLPWLDKTNDTVIAIRPRKVTGFRIVPAPGEVPASAPVPA